VNIRIGGAGNKGIFMLEDYADYMVHVVQGIKFWDMCAVDALMRGRLGITSNKDKKPIIYDHKLDDYTI
jgi:fructose-1,6-bisphosphatase/inositol monophosphatase family enzyme